MSMESEHADQERLRAGISPDVTVDDAVAALRQMGQRLMEEAARVHELIEMLTRLAGEGLRSSAAAEAAEAAIEEESA